MKRPQPKFKVGDKVLVRNGYDIMLPDVRTITKVGFYEGRALYYVTPTDAPWMHHYEEQLDFPEPDWEWADELFAGCDWADIFTPVDQYYDPHTGEYFYINAEQAEITITSQGDVLL